MSEVLDKIIVIRFKVTQPVIDLVALEFDIKPERVTEADVRNSYFNSEPELISVEFEPDTK
jgi:hypothetical protein